MKFIKSQAGFSALHVLLLIVLFGIVGFTGCKVYQSRQQKSTWEDVMVTQDSPLRQTSSVVPEGFVEYKNEELGFKFAYPKAWKIEESRTPMDLLEVNRDLPRVTLTSDNFQEDEEMIGYGGTKTGALFDVFSYRTDETVVDPSEFGPDNYHFDPKVLTVDGTTAIDAYQAYEGPAQQSLIFVHNGYSIQFSYRYKEGRDSAYDQKYLEIRKQILDTIKFL